MALGSLGIDLPIDEDRGYGDTMTKFEHTGLADCCVACAVDDFWQWLDEQRERRQRIKAERGPELNAMWIDHGGEAG